MITDEQGRKWLMQKLYDRGYRYIFRANNHKLYITVSRPVLVGGDINDPDNGYYCQADCGLTARLTSTICPCFDDVRGFISIAEELGVIDWAKVPVDTPILVQKKVELKRHFAKFENGFVYYYDNGRTSWTGGYTVYAGVDKVRLAGGRDEKSYIYNLG